MGVASTRRAAFTAAVLLFASAGGARWLFASAQETGKTSRDKVYTKAQAAAAVDQYAKICAGCHDPARVAPGKKPAPPTVGGAFLDKWSGRSLDELLTTIETTMPSDGSAVLSETEAIDLTAYLLQANGFPDGPAPLTAASAKAITIAK